MDNLFQISSTNLDDDRRHAGPPGCSAAAPRALLTALGTHPVDGKISKTGFVPSVVAPV